jgi:hypothetical protein
MRLHSYLVPVLVAVTGCGQGTGSTEQHVTLCDPASCDGPNPYGAPNYECPDGTIAGPACIEADDGTCGWGIIECPGDDACSTEECGPAPGVPSQLCDDGSIAGPACSRDESGACGWTITECPEPLPCAWDDCPAPAPGAPNFLCDDGVTIGGPACAPDDAGACGWTFVDCPA